MDAVISRRAGMALLLEDEQFSSIHIENLDQVVTRQPSELPFLLGNATDLQSVEGVDLPHVISRLEREVAFEESLHLALMSLDSTLSSGTRQVAVEALEDLLSDDAIVRRLRGVLYAQPLPRGADIKGALAVSETDQTKLAFNLFNTLVD